jgi:hypothetical protein
MSAGYREDRLFGHRATIQDVITAQRQALDKALTEVPSADFAKPLDELVAEFVERFRLDAPRLDRAGITQLPIEEVDIDVSQDPMRAIFDRNRPFYLKGTAVRISVPFSGEPELFQFGTSYFATPVAAEIDGNRLILTHAEIEPSKEAIARDFDSRLNRIEEILRQSQQAADDWNRQISDIVRPRLEARRGKLEKDKGLRLEYPMAITAPPPAAAPARAGDRLALERFDAFISHASEDKDSIARPLYRELNAQGVTVWFDEAVLKLGDSLRRKIDEGLTKCRYGVVILSPHFFRKEWPQKELDGLVARETASGEKAVLPVWHEIDRDGVLAYSPTLADRVAARSAEGVAVVAAKILAVLKK